MKFRAKVLVVLALLCGVAAVLASAVKPKFLHRYSIAAFAHDTVRSATRTNYVDLDADAPFFCWGDSLTYGFGDTFMHNYPDILESAYHRPTENEGIPSETSEQIKARMLARLVVSGPERAIIWAGRNNAYEPEKVKADIAAMVASLNPGSEFLVLEIINGDLPDERFWGSRYQALVKINHDLLETYGSRFVPLRQNLIKRANRRFPADVRNVADDVIPQSLRADALHLNDRGQAAVADAIERSLAANGW